MGDGRRRLLRNLWFSLAVLATLALIGLGLPAVNRLLPSERSVSAVVPYPVAAGVTVRPPPGARVDVTQTQPGPDGGSVLFNVGTVRYAIVIVPFTGSLATAALRLRTKIADTRDYQVAAGERAVTTAQGVAGREGRYSSAGRLGRYAVFVGGGFAVQVTVAGGAADLPAMLPAISASARSLTFRQAS
jgi:hypothetical protein